MNQPSDESARRRKLSARLATYLLIGLTTILVIFLVRSLVQRELGDPVLVPSTLGERAAVSTDRVVAQTSTPAKSATSPASIAHASPTATRIPSPTPTTMPPVSVGASAAIPGPVLAAAQRLSQDFPERFVWVGDIPDQTADVRLEVGEGLPLAEWIYALVAPFATISDTTTVRTVEALWRGKAIVPFYVAEETASLFTAQWDEPAAGVNVIPATELVDTLWRARPARAFVPFERLDLRLKALRVDGQSPLDAEFDPAAYPLTVAIGLVGEAEDVAAVRAAYDGPLSNRDPSRLSRVALSGPSGLGRMVANRMAEYGVRYAGELVAPVLRGADIAHLSNEVPFAPDCAMPRPGRGIEFCAPPEFVELMTFVGIDVNEMTGNHVNDWREENLHFTLDLYEAAGIETYGGGRDLASAREPLLLEHNGNRIAFVGCNPIGPYEAWAREEYAGSLPCEDNYGALLEQISDLREQGYLVVATLQYLEHYQYAPTNTQRHDFRRLAEAGAHVVSGSQGHHAQGFDFHEGAFIHYGLGNLFFDQPQFLGTRQSFIDIYHIYDGRILSVKLWTGMIEDFTRPRPMTNAERAALLEAVFTGSGW